MAEECVNDVSDATATRPVWNETVSRYKHPDFRKSCWQILNSVVPFFLLWYLMYLSYSYSYWLTLVVAVPTAGFLTRIFIIQHDCGHHSFFRSRRANDLVGFLCGVLTLTPYHFWRRTHARHHVTSGNLDHRGHGDVGVLTVEEYRERTKWGRLSYRISRHPLFLFGFGASYMFIVQQRLTHGLPRAWQRERKSIHLTNLALLTAIGVGWMVIGLKPFLLIELPIVVLGAAAGSWLFFVQHQYEETYWQRRKSWDFISSALDGSSYYRLPRILRWFSGNIGYHHIHHLNSRIPNYNLPACYDEEAAFREAFTLGLRESLKCASLKLWDEDQQRMVTFADAIEIGKHEALDLPRAA
jgi:omega-6 fatty acid desaturase (delta-12 desaturase)